MINHKLAAFENDGRSRFLPAPKHGGGITQRQCRENPTVADAETMAAKTRLSMIYSPEFVVGLYEAGSAE